MTAVSDYCSLIKATTIQAPLRIPLYNSKRIFCITTNTVENMTIFSSQYASYSIQYIHICVSNVPCNST